MIQDRWKRRLWFWIIVLSGVLTGGLLGWIADENLSGTFSGRSQEAGIARAKRRIEVVSCGDVQAVGFRYTARRTARDFEVTVNVANLSDGRVRLIAEGEPDELERFLAAVQEAMSDNITDCNVCRGAATGEFVGFVIQ